MLHSSLQSFAPFFSFSLLLRVCLILTLLCPCHQAVEAQSQEQGSVYSFPHYITPPINHCTETSGHGNISAAAAPAAPHANRANFK